MVENYINNTLKFIADNGYKLNNNQFLQETAIFLADLLNVNYVLINKYSTENPNIVTIECFYSKKQQTFFPKTIYNLANTPCQNVINKSICSYPSNTKKLFPKDEALTKFNIESYIGVPLWSKNKQPIGLIAIMNDKPISDVKIIENCVQILAIKLEKYLEKIILNDQINLTNVNLENSQNNFEKLSNLTFEGILIHKKGIATDINLSLATMFGYKKEEIIGKNIIDLFFDKKYHNQIEQESSKIHALPYEIEGIKKDKSTFNVEIESKTIKLGDTKKLRVAAIRDVTERKNVENRLQEAQKIACLGSYSFNVIKNTWNSSKILNGIIGIESNYPKTLESWLQLVHPDDRADFASYLETQILTKHLPFDKQYRIIRNNDQQIRWVHGFGKLIFDKNKNPIELIGTIQDITPTIKTQLELQKAKEKAEESELLFKSLVKQAGDAMYLADFEGNIIEVNDKAVQNSGYSRTELLTMNAKNLEAEFNKLNKNKSVWNKLSSKKQVTIETLHKRKNGSIFPVEINIAALKIGDKKLLLGFARDISERKKISEELKLLSTAVSQSGNSIVITDKFGKIEFVNPKFTEVTGYSSKEVIGKTPNVFKSKTHSDIFYKTLWDTILSGKNWKGIFQNKTKKGKLIWEQATITPIKNEQGIITNFLAIKEDITEQKQSEIDLKEAYVKIQESEDYLKRILETANEGFWMISTNGVTIDVNIKMCSILGYKKDEFVKKSIFDFVDEKNKLLFLEQMTLRDKGLSTSYEIELIKKNGKKAVCLFNTSPVYDDNNTRKASFALVTDVTKLKVASNKLKSRNHELSELSVELFKSNKKLKELSSRFINLFEESPISILEEDFSEVIECIHQKKSETNDFKKYLDENLDFVKHCTNKIKILNVNSASLNLFGVKDKDELTNHLRKTNNENSYEALKKEFLAIANGETEFKTEAQFINTNGEGIYAYVKLAIINENGKAIATIIDITNLKNTESQLILAKEKAEESNRLKTEFLNNMSHEIRTPMNGILGFSELLNNTELSPAKRNYYVSIIQNSGNQLLHVIDDIIEISRLGTKQVKVVENKVCLNDLLLELFSVFDLKAKENGIPLYIKNQLSDCESTIYTDKGKLQKIISNLLENALKFTNKGYVTFGYNLVGETIEIFVKDTGIGIKPEKQSIIFERFSQEEKDVSRNASGLGLGLSIAKENTSLIGGTISVESEKWEGSTFWLKIPYKRVDNPNMKKDLCLNEVNSKQKYKVLVAEDEEVNYLFIEIILLDKIQLNCEIIHAKDGKEAVELCEINEDIDFVLMDINMPIMNGYEATKRIKEMRPQLPVIAQTAYSTPEDKEKAFASGCNDFISKPLNKDALKTIIESHLK
ncbi:PAS domain S-box protein [Lutibacter sp.]|uniref:PAS domain-containing hybrid sensor histidine kinase/response regulator n=1 Tax=Lutibacter sp. TaxID=1925666 RepID=UPI003565BA11